MKKTKFIWHPNEDEKQIELWFPNYHANDKSLDPFISTMVAPMGFWYWRKKTLRAALVDAWASLKKANEELEELKSKIK